jgi:alkylhydroperoxidase family enzyme
MAMKPLDLSNQQPRLPMVPIPPDSEKRIKELGGDLMNLYRIIGHNPTMLAGWIEFAYSLRRDCTTSRELRELMILRGAQICNSAYEWHQHKRMAHKAGVPAAQIEDLLMWRQSPRFSGPERAALAFMESMMACDTPSEVVDELKKHFTPSEIIELSFTAGFYAMVPRFLDAMRVPIEAADMFDTPGADAD